MLIGLIIAYIYMRARKYINNIFQCNYTMIKKLFDSDMLYKIKFSLRKGNVITQERETILKILFDEQFFYLLDPILLASGN